MSKILFLYFAPRSWKSSHMKILKSTDYQSHEMTGLEVAGPLGGLAM